MRNRPLRVLRLAPVLDFGGVESCFVIQSRSWDRPDIQVEYACFWKDGVAADQIRATGARVHVLNADPSIRNPRATYALARFLRENDFDIVHSSIGDANFHAMLCAPLGPWRVIIEEAGMPQRALKSRLVHAALYRLPSRIICVSHAGARNILSREWAPSSKVSVIHNPIDTSHIQSDSERKPDRLLFRAVGRLAAVKNFDGLIRAFSVAAHQVPQLRLEIVGEGEERAKLEALVRQLGMGEHISLVGRRADIASLHRTTGWLLVPSHQEGFGLVAAEAMASGVPVIASDVGGLPEVLGTLAEIWTLPATSTAEWADAIVNASNMTERAYSGISIEMRANAARFHPSRYIPQVAKEYLRLGPAKN